MGLLHLVLENHYLMALIAAADPSTAGRTWYDEGVTPYAALVKAKGHLPPAEETAAVQYIIDRLPRVALTSDWKAFQYALRDLFGMSDFLLTRENWAAIDSRVRKSYRKRDDWYRSIFAKAGTRLAFWCYGKPLLEGPLRGVLSVGEFLRRPRGGVNNSAALTAAFDSWVDEAVAAYNPVSMKVGFAYYRDIAIAGPRARQVDAALKALRPGAPLVRSRAVDDFVHALAAGASARRGLPLQVHTGILAGNVYEQPLPLTYVTRIEPFIAAHPQTRFDIFHGSFPQWGEAIALARKYPNVYLNLCWVTTLSETAAESMLDTALDAVPVNKIMWGGDAHSPEMAYGVTVLFREILDRVLNRRNEGRKLTLESADWILQRSAAELYGLPI